MRGEGKQARRGKKRGGETRGEERRPMKGERGVHSNQCLAGGLTCGSDTVERAKPQNLRMCSFLFTVPVKRLDHAHFKRTEALTGEATN